MSLLLALVVVVGGVEVVSRQLVGHSLMTISQPGEYALLQNDIPREHRPSKASHIIGLRANACWKLERASSGRFPFKAISPRRQCSTAGSGKAEAARDSIEAER